jgi:hypothetical protein
MQRVSDLKSLFYASFDESRVITLLSRLAPMSESARRSLDQFIGEGSHFQSFEVSASPISLVLNVAKDSFTRGGDLTVKRWCEAISRVRNIEDAALVPPMNVIQHGGLTAIVMPKGQDVGRECAKLLNQKLIETAKALGHAGLVMDDYPQVRQANGVPFIIDWSDLAIVD